MRGLGGAESCQREDTIFWIGALAGGHVENKLKQLVGSHVGHSSAPMEELAKKNQLLVRNSLLNSLLDLVFPIP